MQELTPRNIFASLLNHNTPAAVAQIHGNSDYPQLFGIVSFYNTPFGGILISVEVYGLPDNPIGKRPTNEAVIKNATSLSRMHSSHFFGMHIHETGDCTPPFDKTGNHYNPSGVQHPFHAGDMPPLLSSNGYAWMSFYTGRMRLEDIIGRSVIIHSMRDDFTSQPSGDSGTKIGCGVIQAATT